MGTFLTSIDVSFILSKLFVRKSFQITNGPDANSQSLGPRYCGQTLPGRNGTVLTSHHVARLRFVSDSTVAHLGFALTWSAAEPQCGATVSGLSHGTVRSPGYPGQYPHGRDCTWTIQGEPGKRIQFHFATLRIESHRTCDYDYVEVKHDLYLLLCSYSSLFYVLGMYFSASVFVLTVIRAVNRRLE